MLMQARRRRADDYRACGALQSPRAARSTRTLGVMSNLACTCALGVVLATTVGCVESNTDIHRGFLVIGAEVETLTICGTHAPFGSTILQHYARYSLNVMNCSGLRHTI
jgi:hypothetical protein